MKTSTVRGESRRPTENKGDEKQRDGKFVVYVRGGEVFRSEAADHLRTGLLTLEQERAIGSGVDGS